MTKNNFYISLGVWLILIPILGIPSVWRYRIIELTGAFLIIHSAWPAILKRVSQKPRVRKAKTEVKREEKPEEPIISSVVGSPEPIVFNSNESEQKTEEQHVAQ